MGFEKDKREIVFTVLFALFFFGVLSAFFLTSSGGSRERNILDKNLVYNSWGLIGVLIIVALKFAESQMRKGSAEWKRWGWLNALIHDPEEGVPGLMRYRVFAHPGKLYVLSFLFFGTLMLVVGAGLQTSFVGTPQVTFQVTETAQVFFMTEPAASAETALFGAIVMILAGLVAWGVARAGQPRWVYFVFALLLIPIIAGVLGTAWHKDRYGFDDAAQVNVFLFWSVGVAVMLLTGSIIPWLVWHQMNNLVIGAVDVAGQVPVLVLGSIILIAAGVAFIAYLLATWKRGHKGEYGQSATF